MLTSGFHPVPPGKIAAVVTHLEMRERPVSSAPALPAGVTLRHIVAPGNDWYRDLFTRVGGLDWLWSSRLRMSNEMLSEILRDPLVEVHALTVGGRDEGLLELDFREGGSCELAFLGLTPAVQGSGFGRAMMAVGITRAFAQDIACLHVHTCTFDSPVALPFYLRTGFVPIRREIEVMDDPRLDGTLQQEAARHVPIIE